LNQVLPEKNRRGTGTGEDIQLNLTEQTPLDTLTKTWGKRSQGKINPGQNAKKRVLVYVEAVNKAQAGGGEGRKKKQNEGPLTQGETTESYNT